MIDDGRAIDTVNDDNEDEVKADDEKGKAFANARTHRGRPSQDFSIRTKLLR